MSKRILFVVNCPAFFLSHRLPLALAAMGEGYEVHVATMPGEAAAHIRALGITHHELPLSRSGRNPLKELLAFWTIYKLFLSLKPRLVHLVTIKPVLYGGIAARLAGIPGVVAAVSGLGFVFIAKGVKASLVREAVKLSYRLAFGKRNLRVVFQNPDDRNGFLQAGALTERKAVLIRGSGVALEHYSTTAEPEGIPVVIMASRLLRDKGVGEFIDAAKRLKARDIKARFLLVGDVDDQNPASLTRSELDRISEEGCVELLGHRSDIPELFAASNIVVLPSYREGLPKVLVEAAAARRAVITTDVPGCRDAINAGVTGLLVPVCDAEALANAIKQLIDSPRLRQQMGKEGRRLAENEFSIEKIVKAHLDTYQQLEESA